MERQAKLQIEEVVRIEKQDGIATVWIDNKREKMNVVSPELIGIFNEVFKQLEEDNKVKAVILISGKKDFIAGADIKSFAIDKKGDFRPIQAKGHEALAKLENGTKPIIAAVHGTCFGLGTELALACSAIVASNHTSTKFALPEVKLGILPGGGGTQRLPRRVGLQKALEMMTTGKNIYAVPAKKMGLVDELTDHFKLHHAATLLAKKLIEKPLVRNRKKKLLDKFLDDTSIGRSIVFKKAKEQAAKLTHGNYPAVPTIIECVERGYKNGIKDGYEAELDHFERLMLTPESNALRQLFFIMTDNKKNPYGKPEKKLRNLGMLGAGFMGAGITDVSVNNGINVLLKDIKDETLTSAKKEIWKSLKKKLKYKTLTKTQAEEIIGSVQTQLDYKNFDKVDLVIEAVLENMDLKKKIITEIEAVCKPDTIIASNTSSLSVTEMAEHASKPEQFIGLHYFSPVPKMPLLEIVKTKHTADWVISACYEFGIKQGKTCIVVNDGPGFYVNRILAPYINECLLMVEEGIAFDKIDKALAKKGFPVGPITLLDEVGLDVSAHIVKSSADSEISNRPGVEISFGTVKMFEAGYFGKKNKKGFYLYDEKSKRKGPDNSVYKFYKGNGDKELDMKTIQDRALMLMLNEAVFCLEEGIIDNAKTGDTGAVFGIGFLPFTGGPFLFIDQIGADVIVATMNDLKAKYGVKFEPANTLKEMAASGNKFHS